jgi:hypothetical protein
MSVDPCYIPPLPATAYTSLAAAGFPLSEAAGAKVPKDIEFLYTLDRMVREISMAQSGGSTWPRANFPIFVGTVTAITSTLLTDSGADFSTPMRCGSSQTISGCRLIIYVHDDPRGRAIVQLTGAPSTTTLSYAAEDWIARGIIASLSDLVGCKYVVVAGGDLDQYDRWWEPPNSIEYVSSDSGNTTPNGRKIYQAGAYAYFPSYKLTVTTPAVGTFTISVTASTTDTTAAIDVDATPDTIQAAIEALGNVGAGNAFAFGFGGSIGLAFSKTLGTVTATITPSLMAGSIAIAGVSNLLVDVDPIWATTDWTHAQPSFPNNPTSFDLVISDEGPGGDGAVRRFAISSSTDNTIGASFSSYHFSQPAFYSVISHSGYWNPHAESGPRKAAYRGAMSDRFGLSHFPDDSINPYGQRVEVVGFDDGNTDEGLVDCLGATDHNAGDIDVWNDCCENDCCSEPQKSYSPDITKTIRFFQLSLMKTSAPWVIPGYSGGAAPHDWNFPEAAAIASAAEVAAGRAGISSFSIGISSVDTGTGRAYLSGITLPAAYTTDNPPVLWYTFLKSQIVCDSAETSIDVTGSQQLGHDGTGFYITGSWSTDQVGESGTGSWGPDRFFDYEFKHDTPTSVWIPSLFTADDGSTTAVDPPAFINDDLGVPQPYLGSWLVRPASTNYVRFGDTGHPDEVGPAFAAGDLATLRKDNASDPTLGVFDATVTNPLLQYRDNQFTGRCGKTPPNPSYIYRETDRPASGGVSVAGNTASVTTQLRLPGNEFFDFWHGGSGLLIQLQGVVGSTATGTTFNGTISHDGGSTFASMTGSPFLDWNSFAMGLTVSVSRTVSGVTTVYKLLTTAADRTTGVITLQGLDGFTFTTGDVWKIDVPRYELNRYQGHRAVVSVAAYTGHAAREVTVNVVACEHDTVFIDPADALSISSDDVAAGVNVRIICFESGSVLKRDPTNKFWTIPTGQDNRPDPNNDNIKPFFHQRPQNNLPYYFHAYGPQCIGDYWHPIVFNQLAAINRTITDTQKTGDFVSCQDGLSPEPYMFSLDSASAHFEVANAGSWNSGYCPRTTPGVDVSFSDGLSDYNDDVAAQVAGGTYCTISFSGPVSGCVTSVPQKVYSSVVAEGDFLDGSSNAGYVGALYSSGVSETGYARGANISTCLSYTMDAYVRALISADDPCPSDTSAPGGFAYDDDFTPHSAYTSETIRTVIQFDAAGSGLAFHSYVKISSDAGTTSTMISATKLGDLSTNIPAITRSSLSTGQAEEKDILHGWYAPPPLLIFRWNRTYV